jgi:integrase/recombinase XerD
MKHQITGGEKGTRMGRDQLRALLQPVMLNTATIVELVDMFIQHNVDDELSTATIKTRRTHLKQFQEFCAQIDVYDVSLLTNQFIEQYFIEYRKTHSLGTTNTGKRILKVFLAWVRDYKEIDIRSIPETIKSAKVRDDKPKFIERDRIELVVKQCPVTRDRLIIATFAESGIRVSELVKIKVSDVRWDEIDIFGKGGICRTVAITEDLAVQLRRYVIENKRQPDDYLFQNRRLVYGQQLKKETVCSLVKKWFSILADVKATPHQLRHSFAVNLLLNGCDLVTLQKLMGHEDINTTMVYLKITDPQKKQAYKTHFGKSFML